MTDDLVKRLRDPFYTPSLKSHTEAADRIEKLEKSEKDWQRMYREAVIQKEMIFRHQYDHIEKLEAALDDVLQYVSRADWHYLKDETRKALEGKDD